MGGISVLEGHQIHHHHFHNRLHHPQGSTPAESNLTRFELYDPFKSETSKTLHLLEFAR